MFIRKANYKDLASIHKLNKESKAYHRHFDKNFYTIPDRWWKIKKASQRSAIGSKTDLILVAEEGGTIIGYVWGYIEKIAKLNTGKIQDLIAAEERRRKGVASALLKDLLLFFETKNCVVAETTAHMENEPAVKPLKKQVLREKSTRCGWIWIRQRSSALSLDNDF